MGSSTSICEGSERSERPVCLEVRGLDITYKISHYPVSTFRDQFVQFAKNPLGFLSEKGTPLHLIKDFNLVLRKGERLGLLGVNGSGKTSLCRFLAGLHGKRKNIAVRGNVRAIFDTGSIPMPELTGRENALLMARIFFPEVKKEKVCQIVGEAIAFSELGHFIDTPFKNYSNGMKARLFLSLISALPSDLLILDEVFDGADAFFNEKVSGRIKAMIMKSGSVILISHSLEHIQTFCNRVMVLGHGRAVFDGGVKEGIQYYQKHCHYPPF